MLFPSDLSALRDFTISRPRSTVLLLLLHVNIAGASIIWDYSDEFNPNITGFVKIDEKSAAFMSGTIDYSDTSTVLDWRMTDGLASFGREDTTTGLPILSSVSGIFDIDPDVWKPTVFSFGSVTDDSFPGMQLGTWTKFFDDEGDINFESSNSEAGKGLDGRFTLRPPSQVVPEPSSFAVFAGLAGLAAVAYRRKKRRCSQSNRSI